MKTRIVIISLAVLAIVLVAVLSSTGGSDTSKQSGSTSTQASKPTKGATKLVFGYSPEKETLLKPLIAKYNSEQHKTNGKTVFVDGQNVSSGAAETDIAHGKYKPQVWSPAGSLWGRLLNYQTGKQLTLDKNPSLVRTPLVIAMWEPLARTLGWPKKQLGWSDIIDLTLNPKGWGSVGHPEYGKMKLGHTNPDFSTSGLEAVAAQYYAATGKTEGVTLADIKKPKVHQTMADIQRSIVHYGDTTLFFADQLAKNGPAYASAVAMEETTLNDFNKTAKGNKLVAIYPKEGTFFSDSPLFVMQGDWMTQADKDASNDFVKWLQKQVTPTVAGNAGFRPGDLTQKPAGAITRAPGINLDKPKYSLGLPEPKVIAAMKKQWQEDRKPANVMLVVDTSGSMSDENKLEQVKSGLIRGFLPALSPRDKVGLVSFSDQVYQQTPVALFSQNKQTLLNKIQGLLPDGQTAVYDATQQGFNDIQSLNDDTRINAVVVLTDGQDNSSQTRLAGLLGKLRQQANSEGREVRIFTIAYGTDAQSDVLDQIANASGGKSFSGDNSNIKSVYQSISSFF